MSNQSQIENIIYDFNYLDSLIYYYDYQNDNNKNKYKIPDKEVSLV